jgi:hypothetical protein
MADVKLDVSAHCPAAVTFGHVVCSAFSNLGRDYRSNSARCHRFRIFSLREAFTDLLGRDFLLHGIMDGTFFFMLTCCVFAKTNVVCGSASRNVLKIFIKFGYFAE